MAASQNNDNKTFLTIPIEIRMKVYEYVFTDPFLRLSGYGLFSSYTPYVMVAQGLTSTEYHILCACSQSYNEGRRIYFKHNIFILNDGWRIGGSRPRLVEDYCRDNPVTRDIQRLTIPRTAVLDRIMAGLPNLREVYIAPEGTLNLLCYLQSETVEERITEAKTLDFEDLWQMCNETPRVWHEDPVIQAGVRKMVHADHRFVLKLKIRASIASQGYRRVECRLLLDFRNRTVDMVEVDDPSLYQGPQLL